MRVCATGGSVAVRRVENSVRPPGYVRGLGFVDQVDLGSSSFESGLLNRVIAEVNQAAQAQQLLGHTTLRMTTTTYGHLAESVAFAVTEASADTL